jgi:hypothetical protein
LGGDLFYEAHYCFWVVSAHCQKDVYHSLL